MSEWAPEWSSGRQDDSRTVEQLSVNLGRADLARHLAFFYQSPTTQLEVATAFVKRGLESGSRCLYFVDSNTVEAVEDAFRAGGIDVDERLAAGDILIREGASAYEETEFDPSGLVTLLEETAQGSIEDGYEGLWVAGETTWCFHTDLSYDTIVDFEADFDAVCPELPITALCQYDMNRFNENSLAKELWTHRQIIYRNTLCENPFYIPPTEFRSAAKQPLNTKLMLEQAYNLAEAKQQIERREQRLAVVNRILRHNIRNDLNVTREILDLVREVDYVDDEESDLLTTAMERVDEVTQKADKARYIQRTIDDSSMQRTALAPVVDRARNRIRSVHPGADITVDGDLDLVVLSDTNLDVALAELCQHGIRHQSEEPRTVSMQVTTSTETVRIEISYPGPPVRPEDQQALQEGTETPLEHGNGLDLWLAKWIVENAQGQLLFPDTDTQLCVELRRR